MAAISVLAVTFFVSTLLVIMMYSSEQVLKYFETRPQVIAFLKVDATDDDISALRNKLEGDVRLKSVSFVSKEDALDIYKKATSDNPLLGELVSPSTFPASVEFSVVDLSYIQDVIGEVGQEEIVDSVDFTANIGGDAELGNAVERLRNITYYIRLAGIVTVGVMMLTSFLVLVVVVGMRTIIKRPEVESLSLLGATSWFIRAPIVFEAINYSVVGVTFGWMIASVFVMYATPYIFSYFGDIPVLPQDSRTFFGLLGIIFGGELVVGVLIALMGSYVAVSRSLRVIK